MRSRAASAWASISRTSSFHFTYSKTGPKDPLRARPYALLVMAANLAELKEVLVPGLVQLLREAEVNPDLDPTTFLAEFLMRHNPRHGSFKVPPVDADMDRVASEAVEACMGDAKRKGLK